MLAVDAVPRSLVVLVLLLVPLAAGAQTPPAENLLANPDFLFHAFGDHRDGLAENWRSGNVAFWNAAAWGDITVVRHPHVDPALRPEGFVRNLVSIQPGKKFWQFFTLSEARLAHGDSVSLFVNGTQSKPGSLVARVAVLKIESEDGTWSPATFGSSDKRVFSKHGRGELVAVKTYEARSPNVGRIELRIEAATIVGRVRQQRESAADIVNTVGVRVEFENTATEGDVWVSAPCLVRGPKAVAEAPQAREMTPFYRHIPRTVQKLWKGEPIHIIAMGSSIDRASANPRICLYDENPASKTFKQPLSTGDFEGQKVGRPELHPYFGWWQHYFGYSGRLKLELMRKFNLSADQICLNVMACDGSCVGEAHSGLAEYCSLALPPEPGTNGHKSGKTWRELYPKLFARPEGPRPDLVIFGSGANEKTDTPDEVAVFEGTIRWIQRHYPGTEFVVCMWQNHGGYTPNPGDMKALSLRYQIPLIDFGLLQDELMDRANLFAMSPDGGHPQAAGHYLWFKQLERAFEHWDPVGPGQAQLQLPERVHPNSYGWEGRMTSYDEKSARIDGGRFVFDDTAVNCWGIIDEGKEADSVFVDGVALTTRRSMPGRNGRNSMFRFGRTRLGDRHILEVVGQSARLTAVDAKICPDRRVLGIDDPGWNLAGLKPEPFESAWGSPYGKQQVLLPPGKTIEIDTVYSDLSVAYVDAPQGGTLEVFVDGMSKLTQPANLPFVDCKGKKHFMENRKGILGLPYGLYCVRLEAIDRPVAVLGLFAYDSRSNRAAERRLVGHASPGQTVVFSLPFKARPIVLCHEGLRAATTNITPSQVTFSGTGPGTYEVVGE